MRNTLTSSSGFMAVDLKTCNTNIIEPPNFRHGLEKYTISTAWLKHINKISTFYPTR